MLEATKARATVVSVHRGMAVKHRSRVAASQAIRVKLPALPHQAMQVV